MVSVRITLTQNKIAHVSIQDAERVMAFRWHAVWTGCQWYARNASIPERGSTYLHRFVMDIEGPNQVDHRDLNGLNCARSNLREATPAQNSQNKDKHPNNTSGYKGVYWSKARSRWMAYISKDKRRINLGYYDTAEYAARVYDQVAREQHGEFARLNFPDENISVEMSTKKVRRDTKSGYRGVFWNTSRQCWTACITKDGKRHHLGQHKTAEDAARAYNTAAPGIFGLSAVLNVLQE